MLMGDNMLNLPFAPESLNISFVQAGGCSSGIADCLTHEKALPWAVYAQSVKGWYEISVNNGLFRKTEPGGAFLVPANNLMRIVHRTQKNEMEINWIHVQCTVYDSLDLLSFYRLPVILSPAKAKFIGGLVRKVRALQQDSAPQSTPCLLKMKSLAFDIMGKICQCGTPIEFHKATAIERLLPVIRAIEERPDRPLTLVNMAKLIGVSVPRLHVMFREIFRLSPHRYLLEARVKAARMKLLVTDTSIQDIAFATGFDDPYHFSRAFKRLTGLAPSLYREQRTFQGA